MLDRLRDHGVVGHYGDIANAESLRHAGIEGAAIVISGILDWVLRGTSNVDLLRMVRGLAPKARMIVTADTSFYERPLVAEAAKPYRPDKQIPVWTDDYSNLFRILK